MPWVQTPVPLKKKWRVTELALLKGHSANGGLSCSCTCKPNTKPNNSIDWVSMLLTFPLLPSSRLQSRRECKSTNTQEAKIMLLKATQRVKKSGRLGHWVLNPFSCATRCLCSTTSRFSSEATRPFQPHKQTSRAKFAFWSLDGAQGSVRSTLMFSMTQGG
jgi:hypothetical protein